MGRIIAIKAVEIKSTGGKKNIQIRKLLCVY